MSEAKTETKISATALAAKVLKRRKGKSFSCGEIAELVIKTGEWTGSTEALGQALSGAFQRERARKGKESRFIKTAPGQWSYNQKV